MDLEPKAGSFCWIELATTDQSAAKNFYSNLFGWTAQDTPMGPDMTYTMLRLGGKDVAGLYGLMKDQVENHVPPHWMPYIKVTSVDESAAKAVKLGARDCSALGYSECREIRRHSGADRRDDQHIPAWPA